MKKKIAKVVLSSIGTKFNLPQDVRETADLRSEVIAWTTLDPELSDDIATYLCINTVGASIALPCFWPLIAMGSPCLCAHFMSAENELRSQYWILTEFELKIVSLSYSVFTLPGVGYESGTAVRTIPLECIVDCCVVDRGRGYLNLFVAALPEIIVETASVVNGRTTGVALVDYERFIREILNQRDIVLCRGRKEGDVNLAPTMERGSRSAVHIAGETMDGSLV
jgi:hypothetical protein